MSDFKYKISVIIPVYNCEKFISPCIKSLSGQTMSSEDFQIILVNDGSSDSGGELCGEFSEKNENIIYFEKENGGVSSARNKGLELAEGKYIMFLDADDALSANALESVYDFFEIHNEETDLVTYSIEYLDEKGVVTTHRRFDVISHSGVYDIRADFNILQTTMNVCVKNLPAEQRIMFDESLTLGEDQWFIFSHLLKKQKLGFVKDAVYTYYRHSGSASSMNNSPYHCFEEYIGFFNKLLNAARDENGNPHLTAQALVVYNLGWRITSDMLVSHESEQVEREQLERICGIVAQIDNRVICNSIYIDPFHVEYFMRLKKEPFSLAVNVSAMSAFSGGDLWFSQAHTIVLNTLKISGGRCFISGYVKNGVVDFRDMRLFYSDEANVMHELEMFESAYSFYKSKTKTNRFGGFDFEVEFQSVNSITFKLMINGETVTPALYFGFKCAVNRGKPVAACGQYVVSYALKQKCISIKKASAGELAQAGALADRAVAAESKKALIYRRAAKKYNKKNKKIWIYCDRDGVVDNAYYQFIHDLSIDDGVERYYIVDGHDKRKYFTRSQYKNLVKFKSYKHKILFLNCDKIFASFNSLTIFSPFDGLPLKWYSDLTDFEVIYLQHGILHARLPMLYAKEKANVDKVVVSSQFEFDNFQKIYNFKASDLICSGMPRLDAIDISRPAQRKILFSPSWRKNLIGEYENNFRVLFEDKFIKSPFFIQISNFLNSQELADMLEKYDLTLDFKNHPIFSCYDHCFKIDNPRVRVTQDSADMQDYAMMITDYSSIVFDFVYLGRPILYFVPDYEQFRAGITHSYNSLDLPLEEGFGEVAENSAELLAALQRLAENDFAAVEPYKSRMESFFSSRERNHAKALYEAVKD